MSFRTLQDYVGNTPLVRLTRIPGEDNARRNNVILAKLEGNNPAGSVKDRPALSMIAKAEARGRIRPGDTLIEATSGNTGIALAMAAAMRGYRMILIMPENQSVERCQTMRAFGAELILTPKAGSMEAARDLADQMARDGKGIVLDQFANPDNPLAHYEGTGPEIWRDTHGRITHFVSSMGTTGTIMGCSRYLKERIRRSASSAASPKMARRFPAYASGPKPTCRRSTTDRGSTRSKASVRVRPRKWPAAWRGKRASSPGSRPAGRWLRHCASPARPKNAVIVSIVCDRGDRYLSTGVFPA
jgi:cysteine synthase B